MPERGGGGREKMAPLKLGGGKLEDTVLWTFLRTFFWTRIQCTGGIFVLSFSLRESPSPSIPWGIEDGRDFFLSRWWRRKWKRGCHKANYFAKYFFNCFFGPHTFFFERQVILKKRSNWHYSRHFFPSRKHAIR